MFQFLRSFASFDPHQRACILTSVSMTPLDTDGSAKAPNQLSPSLVRPPSRGLPPSS